MRKQRLTGGRLLDFEAFSRNLRALTESRGMLGKDLAAELNITAATLSRYMTNSRVPDIEYVYRISRYFNVTMDFLLGLSNSKRSDFTEEDTRMLKLFHMASPDDRLVIRTILKKYEVNEDG